MGQHPVIKHTNISAPQLTGIILSEINKDYKLPHLNGL